MKKFLLCVSFTTAILAATRASADAPDRVLFPLLAGGALTGASVPDTDGKIVLVDFCASWCVPCRYSFPVYTRLQQDYGAKGLVVIGISVDSNPDQYHSMLQKLKPGFVVLNDASQNLVSQVKVPGMPTSYLLDRSGRIVAVKIGFHSDTTEKELRTSIESLLAEAK